MPSKILVTYASRTGSTAEIAQAIGKTLAEGGAQVDVRAMQDVHDLAPYRAAVAGSAVRKSKWLPEAARFIETHRAELAQAFRDVYGLHHACCCSINSMRSVLCNRF
ncbi:MAG: hypothetical protein FJ009_04840 [Chloroflexi bacterium]|nr:hypothetical protein [Chloroflexota bacterium]